MPRESERIQERETGFAAVTWRVVKAVSKIAIPGFVLGVVLLLVGEHTMGQVLLLPELAKELGTGFIVASIAVFGYEYLRDVSDVVTAEADFREQIALLKEINERSSDRALREDLLRVLRDHENFADALVGTIQSGVDIRARAQKHSADHHGVEPDILRSDACLNLLADLTRDSLASVAEKLNVFHSEISRRYIAKAGHEYRFPDPRVIAGNVLSMMLSSLDRGDYYKSVANVLFYKQDLMDMFERAAEAACDRGITIRRIFNVSNFESEPMSDTRFIECKTIIRKHLELQDKIDKLHPGGYRIRFYGNALHPLVKDRYTFYPPDCPHLVELPESFFGLFCNRTQKSTLLFYAVEPHRASRAWLAFRDQNDPSERIFDAMWDSAAAAPNPFAKDRFEKNWLASTVAQLRGTPSGSGMAEGI